MASKSVVAEIIQRTKQLVDENKSLVEKLKYYQSAVAALEADNREYARRLDTANAAISLSISSFRLSSIQYGPPRCVRDTDWLSNWLYCADDQTVLTSVEEAWREGKSQRALSLLTPIMNRSDLTETERADSYLLLCSILRSTGDCGRALSQAEEAVRIAVKADLHSQLGKANFHRGICYANMHELANAWWCYTLAAHTDGHEELIQTNRDIVERMMKGIPPGDRRLQLTIREAASESSRISDL